MDYDLQDFSLSVLSCSPVDQPVPALYNAAYTLWRDIWFQTLRDLDGVDRLFSDGFTRNDFVTVISYLGTPVALCCFKKMSLRLPATLQDSWFAPWPPEFLAQLARDSETAIIPSWLTIHRDYRRSAGFGFLNLGLILAELISVVTLYAGAAVAFGTPRKDRSVHGLVQQAGAVTAFENVLHHGVPVDLVCFFRDNLAAHAFSFETRRLWDTRRHYYPLPKTKHTIHQAKELYETDVQQ